MSRAISLAALTVLELSPPDRVSCAADAGYSHVGIRLLPAAPGEVRHDLVGDTPLLRELERRLADTGMKVLDAEIFRLKPETRVADYEAAIATAARLGARHLLVAGNDPEEARLIARFAAFCELAQRYGLGASLEFMPWTDAKDLAQAARIVEQAGCANAAVLVDPFHLSRSRSRIEDIAAVPPSRLHFMQLCDVPSAIPPTMEAILAEARGERLMPGDGGVDLVALLRAMPPGIPLSVEAPMHTLARSVGATERARRLLAATRRVLAQAGEPCQEAHLLR
ncbi:sugar phosphate isomerase/epimerase [Pelomonas sp. KK5]|uniref:sugar phosphate isomerase/epimerase family protein n=1 Tax=Pelomonas sp. KK5 TaxID=1855730 RepID=UPI00097BCF4C|nr:sugar phosphate isomerase/epimerase [Pelomonas sp. KK5]